MNSFGERDGEIAGADVAVGMSDVFLVGWATFRGKRCGDTREVAVAALVYLRTLSIKEN